MAQKKLAERTLRNLTIRTADISFDDDSVLKGCKAVVRTNIGIGVYADLVKGAGLNSTVEFLKSTLISWEGFGVPLNEDGIRGLLLEEANELVPAVSEAITNPPKPTSAGSR